MCTLTLSCRQDDKNSKTDTQGQIYTKNSFQSFVSCTGVKRGGEGVSPSWKKLNYLNCYLYASALKKYTETRQRGNQYDGFGEKCCCLL